MQEIIKQISRRECVPVLLGASLKTYELAQDLHRRHGWISHVFCDRVPLPFRFSVCMRFHRVCRTRGHRLLFQALQDFADQMGSADVIHLLIPCTEEYTRLLCTHAPLPESRYVLYGVEGSTKNARQVESEGGAT